MLPRLLSSRTCKNCTWKGIRLVVLLHLLFIFSTGIDGKIKAWLYDNLGSRADYDAPGHSCTTMAYSADGTRLFSCGTSKEGESYIVEWNESEGAVKWTYHGLGKRSVGVVQFDTTKFWDMDNVNLLTTTDADGRLPASPCIRFNKEGTLLAVSTSENGVKILANSDSVRLLRSIESRALDASTMASESAAKAPIIGTFCASSSAAGTNVGISKKRCGDTCVNYGMIRRTRRNVRKTRKIGLSLKSSIQLAQRHLERCNTISETRMERSLDVLICITRHTLVRKGKHGSIMKLKLDMDVQRVSHLSTA